MWFIDETNGDLTIRQGDADYYPITNVPVDKNYRAYFMITDKKRNKIGQVEVDCRQATVVKFPIPSEITDLLTVPKDQESEEYYFGIKLCNTDETNGFTVEDTVIIGNKNKEDDNIITVYPKSAEGDD